MPLLVAETTTDAVTRVLERDSAMLVWWATEVECVSAIARLERQGDLTADATLESLARLDALAAGWHEAQPVSAIRRAARRLLRVHQLRAADALQLAAAIVCAEGDPGTLEIVSLDARLIDAARREGFSVLEPHA
ncbi:MAG: type II toxin-antitoxin system VapC family toxin [Solirubrobacteraceae bacterium]